MRSIATLQLQYAHQFYRFEGEAQHLHGHTGIMTIEVEDSVSVNPVVNMVYPCNEIQKVAWNVLKNFDHVPPFNSAYPAELPESAIFHCSKSASSASILTVTIPSHTTASGK